MTDALPADPAAPPPQPAAAPPRKGFSFTDDGCRTEIRLGALLVLAGMFLWLWLGPTKSNYLNLLGIVLILVGVPLQVRDARRSGRPGYPWKLGLTLAILGALMWKDLLYRERYDGPLGVQPMAPVFLGVGLWILAWWPFAKPKKAATA
jgi:hypothetical protein